MYTKITSPTSDRMIRSSTPPTVAPAIMATGIAAGIAAGVAAGLTAGILVGVGTVVTETGKKSAKIII